jgi:hypothetical protein
MLTTCVMRKNMDNLFQVDIKTRLCCSPSCQPRCCKCCNNVVENLFKGVTLFTSVAISWNTLQTRCTYDVEETRFHYHAAGAQPAFV